jgi:DNA integrity scanning protein DisA with diadenylate cyclase activity
VFSNLLKEIASLDHGTIVIVSSEAQEEAQRLRKQGTQIEPRVLNQGEFQSVSSIDGALLFDPNGRCHAIGVVLDGMAKENLGDPSRGSRYNSMIKYVQTRVDLNKSVVGVVFSDDGYSNYYSGMHGADVSS